MYSKAWSVLFGVVMIACILAFLISPAMGWWLPLNVSTFGPGVDKLFYLILAITAFFFVLTEAILVYNMYRFIAEPGSTRKAPYVHGNHTLELFWTAIPAGILLLLAILQINVWAEIKYQNHFPKIDDKTQQMDVSARQFEWRVRYPSPERMESWKANVSLAKDFGKHMHADDVRVVNEVHTYKGQKVLVHLSTKDVLHSFYLPNLRLKQDAVPGKTIPVWFETTQFNTIKVDDQWVDGYNPNTKKQGDKDYIWELVCAELCGWGHYKMIGKLYVHEDEADFMDWLRSAQKANNQAAPAD